MFFYNLDLSFPFVSVGSVCNNKLVKQDSTLFEVKAKVDKEVAGHSRKVLAELSLGSKYEENCQAFSKTLQISGEQILFHYK